MDYKLILGILAVIAALIGFAPYFYNILKNKTKPHVFSWFIWGLLSTIGFFAQLSRGGGFGTWVMLATGFFAFIIFLTAFFKYKIDYIKKIDWLCFAGALLGIILWILTKEPLAAIIIVTITDAVGFAPTYRKTYQKPYEETITLYALGSVKFLLSLFALQSFNLTTVLYPASLVLTNGFFVTLILFRRMKIKLRA